MGAMAITRRRQSGRKQENLPVPERLIDFSANMPGTDSDYSNEQKSLSQNRIVRGHETGLGT